MARFVDFWKIVTPATRNNQYQQPPGSVNLDDSMNLNSAGYAAFSSTAWYSNLLKGATARLQRYKQYDAMDYGDISRALDIIAEEISVSDKRNNLPFIIDYQIEENQTIPEPTVTTVRAALRHWCKEHTLNKRVFNVARTLCKYGDCFFRKTSDTKRWEYVDPTRVIGIEINDEGDKVAYHIRPSSFMSSVASRNPGSSKAMDSVEISPAIAMIHFTLSDDMGESAPFGLSILQGAFKDFQKLTMLEDAAIIYRIVRAPERRVFYIDVGNMPPQRVKQYIEQIRNDLRQKRMPNTANANGVDSQYSADEIGSDFYFPTTASGRGSRVETLPGGATWEIPELEYFFKKVLRALRVPSSYMLGQDATPPGAQFNDGKVGVAYMEERIFSNFVQRIQACVDMVFDEQFKTYLYVTGVKVDPDVFKLSLPEPQNFALYRQAALDTDLISSFKSIADTPYLSKRFMLERFLGLNADDILKNQAMLQQEKNIKDGLTVDVLQQMYDDEGVKREQVTPEEIQPEDNTPPPEDAGEEEEPAPNAPAPPPEPEEGEET
jgi:hypothetical protein